MEDINLHFTGDFTRYPARTRSWLALLDNHLHHGNALGLDLSMITWPRAVDMNDRALRRITVAVGGGTSGVERSDRFVITSASGSWPCWPWLPISQTFRSAWRGSSSATAGSGQHAVRHPAHEIGATGAGPPLRDALRPNLVQTLEGAPAFVHAGPFANIAHGCSSVVATRTGLALADYVVTEAGFGSDLGAEKFFDIKCAARAGSAAGGDRSDGACPKLNGGQMQKLATRRLDGLR